ncbi:hypothetical protein Taro_022965 [Colocasia esculenta]|uniref:SHSP domain-containing protein n=1 Tax=Colocasia esculenta TaxID=4460 RepID=A0A843VG06_COLES|nr:hypothetical protein [Colocasia esculenta]
MSSPPNPGPGEDPADPFHLEGMDTSAGSPFSTASSIPARCRISFPFQRPTNSGWIETTTAHVFSADVQGFRKEVIQVEVEDGRMLVISFEFNAQQSGEVTDTPQSGGWPFPGNFKYVRRYRMPDNADLDETTAALENDVLTVTVPKAERGSATVRLVEISG